jgi:hypothetical protein
MDVHTPSTEGNSRFDTIKAIDCKGYVSSKLGALECVGAVHSRRSKGIKGWKKATECANEIVWLGLTLDGIMSAIIFDYLASKSLPIFTPQRRIQLNAYSTRQLRPSTRNFEDKEKALIQEPGARLFPTDNII